VKCSTIFDYLTRRSATILAILRHFVSSQAPLTTVRSDNLPLSEPLQWCVGRAN
jgi:hypothetical protein